MRETKETLKARITELEESLLKKNEDIQLIESNLEFYINENERLSNMPNVIINNKLLYKVSQLESELEITIDENNRLHESESNKGIREYISKLEKQIVRMVIK